MNTSCTHHEAGESERNNKDKEKMIVKLFTLIMIIFKTYILAARLKIGLLWFALYREHNLCCISRKLMPPKRLSNVCDTFP